MASKTLTVIAHREEDMHIAECPEIGTVDQGATIEAALENLKEATRMYLEEFPLFEDLSLVRKHFCINASESGFTVNFGQRQ